MVYAARLPVHLKEPVDKGIYKNEWPSRVLRNWSKWPISFRSFFSKRNFSKFCFDSVKISIIFNHFLIEKDRNKFRSFSILRLTIEIFRNEFWKISIVGLKIKIFWNYFEKFWLFRKNFGPFRGPKWSKFFKIFSKNFEIGNFISNFVSFRFVSFRKPIETNPWPKFRNILPLSH